MNLPDEAVEAAADAIWFNLCGDIRQTEIDKIAYRDAARAALEAALPHLVPDTTHPPNAADHSPQPASGEGEPVAWHNADIVPQVRSGTERHFIVAVRRAHSGKTYSFPALYLHDFPLNFDDGERCICDDKSRHTDDGCPVTGWHSIEANDEGDGQRYSRLSFQPSDEFLAWTDVPQFSSVTPHPSDKDRVAELERELADVKELNLLLSQASPFEAMKARAEAAEALADRSTSRLAEIAEPGWIGAFAARDHAIEGRVRAVKEAEQLRSDLAAAEAELQRLKAPPSEPSGVRVKPLVWSESIVFGHMKRRGRSPFGEEVAFIVDGLSPEYVAVQEAAAQVMYEARIRSALALPSEAVTPKEGA